MKESPDYIYRRRWKNIRTHSSDIAVSVAYQHKKITIHHKIELQPPAAAHSALHMQMKNFKWNLGLLAE